MNRARDTAHVRELLRSRLVRRRKMRIGTLIECWSPERMRRGKRLILYWWHSALARELAGYAEGVN